MEYISSDTNVWLDFATINRLEIPFKLPYTYIMNEDAITDELLSPKELRVCNSYGNDPCPPRDKNY